MKYIVMADKGYYSYKNYELSVLKYKIIHINIFQKKNTKKEKILSRFCYPLECFTTKKHEKPIYSESIFLNISEMIDKWERF